MDLIVLIIASTWYILPAYIADMTPAFLHGWGPIDQGKNWKWDGRRILGDGKSIRGSLGGILTGAVVGLVLWFLLEQEMIMDAMKDFLTSDLITGDLMVDYTLRGFLLGFGTILGDVSGSFIKRRLNFTRGVNAIGLDQLGFLIAALIVTLPFYPAPWEFIVVWILVAGLGQPLFHEIGKILGVKPIGDDKPKISQ
ncbi:MAG: CDP-archaeol synthase [Promethearchaeota archaeon]